MRARHIAQHIATPHDVEFLAPVRCSCPLRRNSAREILRTCPRSLLHRYCTAHSNALISRNFCARAMCREAGYFGTAADGRIRTASGVGGQHDRRRVVLRGLKLHPAVPRRLVSLRVPRRCLRRVVAYRSPPPASHTRCLHTSPADSRPPAGRSARCLPVRRAPQVSFNYLFESCRPATRSDVTNAIARVDIDSIGIAAGRRIASAIRPSAVRPRSPARVPSIPHPGNPVLAAPCACTRFQPLRWWEPGLCSLQQLRAQA